MLDYLESRLAARDLSAEEALAMLGAVHEGLNNPSDKDRSVYQKYSEFMELLRIEMPAVHDYVVSAWGQRGENQDKAAAEQGVEPEYDNVEAGGHSESGHVEDVKKSEADLLEGGEIHQRRVVMKKAAKRAMSRMRRMRKRTPMKPPKNNPTNLERKKHQMRWKKNLKKRKRRMLKRICRARRKRRKKILKRMKRKKRKKTKTKKKAILKKPRVKKRKRKKKAVNNLEEKRKWKAVKVQKKTSRRRVNLERQLRL